MELKNHLHNSDFRLLSILSWSLENRKQEGRWNFVLSVTVVKDYIIIITVANMGNARTLNATAFFKRSPTIS